MLPAVDCSDTTPQCNTLNDMADAILAVCSDALCDCGCGTFDLVVSQNEPQLGGNYVGVWVARADAAPSSQASGLLLLPRMRYTYAIKVHETGWPMLDGQADRPPAEAIDHAGRFSNNRIEYVLRRVLDALRRDTMKLSGAFQSCGPLLPLPHTTGAAAWRFDVTVELAFKPFR